jgi:hypothetical protein
MVGKKGMSGPGGSRQGAGSPFKFAPKKGEVFIMERSSLTAEHNEIVELWHCLSVSDGGNALEFQVGSSIVTIRRPEPGEVFLRTDGV